jgi:hypothetical protein
MLRVLTTFVPAVALIGCVENGDEGFIIRNNTASAVGATACQLTGEASQPFTSHGMVNSHSPMGYILTPLVQSRVTAPAGQELARTVQLTGATVTLAPVAVSIQHMDGSFATGTVPALTGADATFDTLFSGAVSPGGSTNVNFVLVPPSTIFRLMAGVGGAATDKIHIEVQSTIVMHGTLAGDKQDAAPFSYPLTVCNDCVVVDNGTCPLIVDPIRPGDACNPFQDGIVDCCHDQADNLICPGPKAGI